MIRAQRLWETRPDLEIGLRVAGLEVHSSCGVSQRCANRQPSKLTKPSSRDTVHLDTQTHSEEGSTDGGREMSSFREGVN